MEQQCRTFQPAVAVMATEEAAEETAESPALPVIDWNDGDTVTVYHQGPIEAEAGTELIALGLLIHR
jgi:endonuclease YncB( thermonuclease family)